MSRRESTNEQLERIKSRLASMVHKNDDEIEAMRLKWKGTTDKDLQVGRFYGVKTTDDDDGDADSTMTEPSTAAASQQQQPVMPRTPSADCVMTSKSSASSERPRTTHTRARKTSGSDDI